MTMTMTRKRIVTLFAVLLLPFTDACTALKRFAYSGFGRDDWQQPEEVIGALDIEKGSSVADLGSGGGYFTFWLADAVGADGRIYAVDVDEALLDDLTKRAGRKGHANFTPVVAELDDPALPAPVDLIFVSNTYHHLENRVDYFDRAAKYLRPGGRVAVVEHSGDGWLANCGHSTEAEKIRSEMEAAGYTRVASHDFLDRQNFQVFAREQ